MDQNKKGNDDLLNKFRQFRAQKVTPTTPETTSETPKNPLFKYYKPAQPTTQPDTFSNPAPIPQPEEQGISTPSPLVNNGLQTVSKPLDNSSVAPPIGKNLANFRSNEIGAKDESFESYRARLEKISPALVQGTGYNLKGAYEGGLEPELSEDGQYHLGSRNPVTGELLKSKDHPTYQKMIDGEKEAGYEVYEQDGKLFSKSKDNSTDSLPQEKPSYKFKSFPFTEEDVLAQLNNAKSPADLEGLEISNDPALMDQFQKKMKSFSEPQVQAQSIEDKPWYEDVWDGIRSGTRSALSATAEGGSEIMDLVGTGALNPALIGMGIGQYNLIKQLQAKGYRGAGAGSKLREVADTQAEKADVINKQADTESIGFFVGQVMPYAAGSAVAIATAPVSAPLAAGIGAANVGTLALASFGSGIQEYDRYKAEKGTEADPYARLGIGLLYGGAEFGMERLSLNKLMPKQFRGKIASAMFGAVPTEVMEKNGKQLIEEFANSSSSRKKMVDGLLKDTAKGILVEGGTEAGTEIAQEFTNWLYLEKEDRSTWSEMLENTASAFAGGAIMGGGLGPLSYGSQRAVNAQRRKDAGKVVIAQDSETGEAVEIMGVAQTKKSKDNPNPGLTYDVVRPNGKVLQISENNIGEVVELPYDTFQGLLNGGIDGQTALESRTNQDAEAGAIAAQEEVVAQYEPFTFTDMNGMKQIGTAQMNGEQVFVTNINPDGSVTIAQQDGTKKIVGAQMIQDQKVVPFEDFLAVMNPIPEGAVAPFDPSNPVQKGEEIAIPSLEDGSVSNFVVTGVDMESGTVQLESISEDGVFDEMPLDMFQQLRKPAEENTASQEVITEPTGAEKLRKMFVPGDEIALEGSAKKEEAKALPKADKSKYDQISTLIEQKLGVKPDFSIVGLQGELRVPQLKDFLSKQGEIGAELADIIEFAPASLRLLNSLPDVAQKETASEPVQPNSEPLQSQENGPINPDSQPTGLQKEQTSPEQAGLEQTLTEDAPAESADQGTDSQIPIEETTNQPTTTDEVRQTEPQPEAGQNDVQKSKDQEKLPEPASQEGLAGETGLTPSKYEDVDTASTAEELASLYDAEIQNREGITDPKESTIANVLGGQKINPDSFSRNNDRNNVTQAIGRGWFAKRGQGMSLDQLAQEASESMTPGNPDSISPADIADFMVKYPSSKAIDQPTGNPRLKAIADKYESLTGKKINKRSAATQAKKARKSAISNPKGELLDSDDKIKTFIAENEDVRRLLQEEDSFQKPDGSIDNQLILDKIKNDTGYFTVFPYDFTPEQLSVIETHLTNQINEGGNRTGSETIQADAGTGSQTGDGADNPGAQERTAGSSSEAGTSQQQQGSDTADNNNPEETGRDRAESPSGDIAVDVKPAPKPKPAPIKSLKDLNETVSKTGKKSVPAKKPNQTKQEEVGVLEKEELQDVGEKIGGAKKDKWELVEASESDIKNLPLSKSFPKPDFKKLVEIGQLSEDNAIFLRYLYENIEPKPRKYGLARYEKSVKDAMNVTNEIIADGMDGKNYSEGALSAGNLFSDSFTIFHKTMKKLGFPLNPAAVGNFRVMSAGSSSGKKVYFLANGKKYADRERFDTMDAAIDHLEKTLETRKGAPKITQFSVYQDRNTKDFFIGKKGAVGVVRVMEGFKTAGEALDFRDNNQAQVQEIWDAMKSPVEERRAYNRTRVGTDWRNGENISAEVFRDTFGFRGVEFGNWVNNKERQNSVNDAYDAFMDLASLINVDPKALSLNGSLGFAFGARGSGKAMAHYESGKVVINLTKTKGAGSLAHEWWHAIDNYFSRKRDTKDGFISEAPYPRSNRDGSLDDRIRLEMLDAFKAINTAIGKTKLRKRSGQLDAAKSTPYWSTNLEMTARSFENFVIEKLGKSSQSNDYLANFKEMGEWISDTKGNISAENNYPYPLQDESATINEAYEQFFQALKVDESDPNKAMFFKVGPSESLVESNRAQEMIEAPKGKPTKTAQEVDARAQDFIKTWQNAPAVVTVNNGKEVKKLYPELKQYSDEEIEQVPALFITNPATGKKNVVLIASHSYLSGKNAIEKAILHEAIGHFGVRQVLMQKAGSRSGKFAASYDALMKSVFDAKSSDLMMKDIVKRYFGKDIANLTPAQQAIAGDEFIAHVAQEGVKDTLVDRVVAKLRQLMRQAGFNMVLTDAEIRALIGNSMRLVAGKNGKVSLRSGIDTDNLPRKMIMGEQGATNLDQREEASFRLDNLAIAREMEQSNLKDRWIIEDISTNSAVNMDFPTQKSALDYLDTNKTIEVDGKKLKSDRFTTSKISAEEQIRMATGWERGADGKWRYEVADPSESMSKLFEARGEDPVRGTIKVKLQGLLGKEFNQAYPSLRGIDVTIKMNPFFNMSGSYSENIAGTDKKKAIEVKASNFRNAQSVLFHEVQHAIQREEGFAKGGNPDTVSQFGPELVKDLKSVEKLIRDAKKLKNSGDWASASATLEEIIDTDSEVSTNLKDWAKRIVSKGEKEIESFLKETPNGQYIRLMGEVEARNVQTRMSLSPEQRRTQTLQSTEDVSREDQIFIENADRTQNLEPTTQTGSNNADIRFLKVDILPETQTAILEQAHKDAESKWTKKVERYQDNMIRGKNLIKRHTKGDKIDDAQDFYTKENLSKGKTLVQTEDFMKKLYDPAIQTAKQISDKYDLTFDQIGDFLIARHHPERKAYFLQKEKTDFMAKAEKDHITNPELQAKSTLAEYLNKQESKINKQLEEKDPEWPTGVTDEWAAEQTKNMTDKVPQKLIDQLESQVKAMSEFVNDKRLESGLISDATYRTLRDQYKNYVPLRGWEDTQNDDLSVYSPLIAAKGRTSKSGNAIPYLVTAAQEAIMKGENNKVRQSVLEFVKSNVSPKEYHIRNAYYVKTGELDDFGNPVWEETNSRPTKEQFESGDAVRSFNPEIHKAVKMSPKGDNVLPVMVKGQKVFIEFKDAEIAKAIKNASQDKIPKELQKLRAYTRWLSSMYTQYSPEFGIRNLVRDVGFGTFNILVDDNPKMAASTLAGLPKSGNTLRSYIWNDQIPDTPDGKLLKEFLDAGALTGYSDLKNVADIFEQAQKEINDLDQSGFSKVKNLTATGIEKALKPLDVYNRSMENAMRFSYYKELRTSGLTEQQAAIKAKDLTVNFNRKGNASSLIGTVYIFFNASVQGTERLARSFVNPKTRKKAATYAGTIMAAGLMQGLMNSLFMGDDDDEKGYYDKIPDYIRKNNIIIPRGPKGEYIAIPLPYGINVFYSLGETIGRSILGRTDPGTESLAMLSTVTNVFSPLGGFDFVEGEQSFAEKSLQMVTPSAIKPLADIAFNRNFAGVPIYREPFTSSQYQQPNSQMYFQGVNPAIRATTDALNSATGGDKVVPGMIDINPEIIEYGIEQYLGGPAQFVKNLATTTAYLMEGENIFKEPYARRTPFYRSYVKNASSEFQISQDYYENRDKVNKLKQRYKIYLDSGDGKEAQNFFRQNKDMYQLVPTMEAYTKKIAEYSKAINAAKKAGDDAQAEQIIGQRTKLMNAFNTKVNRKENEIREKNLPKPIKSLKDLLED